MGLQVCCANNDDFNFTELVLKNKKSIFSSFEPNVTPNAEYSKNKQILGLTHVVVEPKKEITKKFKTIQSEATVASSRSGPGSCIDDSLSKYDMDDQYILPSVLNSSLEEGTILVNFICKMLE